MTITKMFLLLFVVLLVAAGAFAQAKPPSSENGAVSFYADSGWSFGVPAVRASASLGGVSAISPEKKTLIAPSFGVGITAWKFIVPFFDFTAYDTGTATARVGNVSTQAQADTFSYNGGVRFVGGRSRVRAYGEIGGGAIHQTLKGSFTFGGVSSPATASGSIGSVMYGGGFQVFAGRRWGTDIGFDAFHLTRAMNGAGQNFGRVRIGVFYQTKSVVE